jgi:hypothetical protein
MKKITRGHVANPESTKRRALRLSQETVRVLSAGELTAAVGACDTTSFTTEHTAKC